MFFLLVLFPCLNLVTEKKFFRRADGNAFHINILSNKFPTTIKQLPKMISKKVLHFLEKTSLTKSSHGGYLSSITFRNINTQYTRKNKQVSKTNLGEIFTKVPQTLSQSNKYHEVFNCDILKMSYCCNTNVENIIKQHYFKI